MVGELIEGKAVHIAMEVNIDSIIDANRHLPLHKGTETYYLALGSVFVNKLLPTETKTRIAALVARVSENGVFKFWRDRFSSLQGLTVPESMLSGNKEQFYAIRVYHILILLLLQTIGLIVAAIVLFSEMSKRKIIKRRKTKLMILVRPKPFCVNK